MFAELTRSDRLLLGILVPLAVATFVLHVHETARSGLAQLPVFAEWVPDGYPRVGGYRLETDSSGSGLELGDRLIRVGDRDLRGQGYVGFHAIGLSLTKPGQPVPLVAERDGVRFTVPLEARPHPRRWSRVPLLILLAAVGVLVVLRAPGSPSARRFATAFMLYGISQAHFYGGPEWKSWAAAVVWNLTAPLMMYSAMRWIRFFPDEMRVEHRVGPFWEWAVPLAYIVFVRANYVLAWPLPLEWVPRVSFATHGIGAMVGICLGAHNYYFATPVGRRRVRWAFLGLALGFVPVVVAGAAPLIVPEWDGFRDAFAVGFIGTTLVVAGAVMAVIRGNAFDVDRLIGATAAWSLAAGVAVAVLVLVTPMLTGAVSSAFGLDSTPVRLGLAALLGALVIPAGFRLRPQVDRVFFPERVAVQADAAALLDELGRFRSPEEVMNHAAMRCAGLMDAKGHALYVRSGDEFLRRQGTGLSIPAEVPAALLPDRSGAVLQVPAPLRAAGVELLLPVRGDATVDALLLFGGKRSGDIYTRDDARVLMSVAAKVEMERLRFEKEAADRASSAKTDLLAATSHDLRQPLHAVALLAEALAGQLDAEDEQALVERIGSSTQDLDEMLTSLLDRSKLDAGAVRPDVRSIGLSALFEQLEHDFAGEASAKALRLRVVPTALAVHSDRVLLLRILRNLLSNAIRYTEQGAVLLAARRRGEDVVVEVRDSGPGIPAERHDDVFEAFRQLPGGSAAGLGLGLSIVRSQARLLGHEVRLRSAPGRGSTFTLRLPRASVAPPPTAEPEPREASDLEGRRVLVVDDDPRVRAATLALLGQWGCEALGAASGAEACGLGAESGWVPDFAVVDHHLGGTERGADVVARLAAELGRTIPAAIVSAETDPEVLRALGALGLPVLRKPVRPAELRALIARGVA